MAMQMMPCVNEYVAPIADLLFAVRTEIIAFIVAALAHWILFGKHRVFGFTPTVSSKAAPGLDRSGGSGKAAKSCSPSPPGASANRERISANTRAAVVAAVAGRTDEEFSSLPEKTTVHYNAYLEDRIRGGDKEAATRAFQEAKEAGLADTTTFNTMMKVDLQRGELERARKIVTDMRACGLSPNCTTFNELLNLAVSKGEHAVWPLFDEMVAAKVKPNHITCSILLKCTKTNPQHLDRVLSMVDVADDHVDDVLLGSMVEACVRAGRPDVLRRVLQRRRSAKGPGLHLRTAHGFGSVIRAYGYLKDMPNVWALWRDMRTRNLELSSITIGCMVEAVATSGDPEGAHSLIRELMADEKCKPLVNAVVYCSVLKGYSHQKRFDNVWAVYKEMVREGMQLTIVTYNTLVDACARSSSMVHIPTLLEAMAKQNISPNVVTYSAIIKGYCQESRLERALEVFEDMRQHSGLQPDEHTYNTLINGCARKLWCDKGLSLLEDMIQVGVHPSNFTLSVLVKLLGRGRRTQKAFEVCEEISKKFGLRLNSHVYNNLMNACLQNNGFDSGLEVFAKMLREHVRPDARTYTLLINAAVGAGRREEVASLLRASAGLRVQPPLQATQFISANLLKPHDDLTEVTVKEALAAVARIPQVGHEMAETLSRELQKSGGRKNRY
eukprot:TRINITY_DN32682_c0_g1_i1.p1 TRINITY_DN32682_c0_g1~~TRINITY_DN32682_c0_g1_i1.p1  ORF type:complete len:669 (+),score=174.10 TRINITY_DN32682_c0_g1_i1:91-2097(+)